MKINTREIQMGEGNVFAKQSPGAVMMNSKGSGGGKPEKVLLAN
jgi:hypothetical protein